MEFQRFGEHYIIRIDRGEEVLTALQALCRKESTTAAEVVGIGAADRVTVGLYHVEEQRYHSQTFTGEFEITNLTGSVSQKDGEVYLHCHITCCQADFATFGGHLNECRISGTCELHLVKLEGVLGRRYDAVTGLNVYDFQNQSR